MKMSKAMYISTISVIIIVSIIMTVLGMSLSTMVDKEESLIYNAKVIRDNYNELNVLINENRKIKIELTDKLSSFTDEDYSNNHEEYIEIINRYQKNVEIADKIYTETADKCTKDYKDDSISILCEGYTPVFEELINHYITNINNYNNKIITYNEKNNTDYKIVNMIHKEYLDLNQDGVYSGTNS